MRRKLRQAVWPMQPNFYSPQPSRHPNESVVEGSVVQHASTARVRNCPLTARHAVALRARGCIDFTQLLNSRRCVNAEHTDAEADRLREVGWFNRCGQNLMEQI